MQTSTSSKQWLQANNGLLWRTTVWVIEVNVWTLNRVSTDPQSVSTVRYIGLHASDVTD